MSTSWISEIKCARCGTHGRAYWSESGGMEQHERCSKVEGLFQAIDTTSPVGPQAFEIRCKGCNERVELYRTKQRVGV